MKKAKTNRKLFTILSAILGVVFAFTMGVTYCLSDLNYIFGTHPKSTTAFMGNQQYIIVNDTLENPIHFSEGSHNFEIAIQYSIDYNFDFMLEYSLSWSGENSVSTDNVILRFANRDSFIVDEDYIYYVGSSTDSQPTYVTSGSGKLPIITGITELGEVITDDAKIFDTMLIAGKPRSGKSWYVGSVLMSLMMFNSPEDVQFIIIDPKKSTFFKTMALMPHVAGLHDDSNVLEVMNDIIQNEAERRKELLASNRCDDI